MTVRLLMFAVGLVALAAVWAFSFVSKRYEEVAAGALPLAPRSFPRLTVVTVGSGGTFENHQRLGPAVAVARGEDLLLVDAGRAVAQALRAAEIPVQQPRAVLLTSLLPENTLGLDDLMVGRAYVPGTPPLRVLGPPGTRALVERLERAHAPGLEPGRETGFAEPAPAQAEDLAGAARLDLGELSAEAVPLEGPLPALAWRLEVAGSAVLVSSLGFAPETLVENGRGARLWIHEAVYGEALDVAIEQGAERPDVLTREAAWHTRLEEVGDLARRMGVPTLVLSRLRPPPVFDFQYRNLVAQSFEGRVVIAQDGLELTP